VCISTVDHDSWISSSEIRFNYAGFLLARERFPEAIKMAETALASADDIRNQCAAEALFYLALAHGLTRGPDQRPLVRLKQLLTGGYDRQEWSFDDELAVVAKRLPDKIRFYRALAAAIVDEKAVPALEQFPEWHPLPVEAEK
jgi:hypothetical protein